MNKTAEKIKAEIKEGYMNDLALKFGVPIEVVSAYDADLGAESEHLLVPSLEAYVRFKRS